MATTKNAQTTAPKLATVSQPILNSLFKSYEPMTRAAPLPRDPTAARREKFVRAVREQLALLENADYARVIKRKDGTERRVKPRAWWSTDAAGVVLVPRFALRTLDFGSGATALRLGEQADVHAVAHALAQLAEAAKAGELDGALAAAAPKPPKTKTAKATAAA